MKKIYIVLFIVFLLIVFFTNSCYATKTGKVFIKTNKDEFSKGEEIELTVNIQDSKTSAFNFSLYFDESKLEYISDIENANILENQILFVWFDSTGGNEAKEDELVKFKFKAKENGIATFTISGEFYSETGQLIQTDFEQKQIQIGKAKNYIMNTTEKGTNSQKDNTDLKELRIDIEGLSPNFKKYNYEYYLNVPNDVKEIEVLAITENPNSKVEISGNTNLKEGLNNIEIQVTSEDLTQKKVYYIQATKTPDLELANTNLETLAIEDALLNPAFDINETIYKTEISSFTENINILAIPQNEKASVEIQGKENLKQGNNLITIIVTAPNGFTQKKYKINVYKRNEEEQNEYNKEQENQDKRLEQAHEAEKIDSNIESEKPKLSKIYSIIIILGIILIIVIILRKIKK